MTPRYDTYHIGPHMFVGHRAIVRTLAAQDMPHTDEHHTDSVHQWPASILAMTNRMHTAGPSRLWLGHPSRTQNMADVVAVHGQSKPPVLGMR